MGRIRGFALGVWDFVVGDDWVTALGVVVALAITALLDAWWVMPLAVAALFASSLARARR
jgi:hypothetical protein